MTSRVKATAAASFFAVWYLGQTWRGLLSYFSEDDLMNMYWAWTLPLRRLILANLSPFTAVYRPIGSVYYRVMYACAGLHPLPFRIVCYSLMMLNIWLVYRLIRQITGSSEIAILAALIGSVHKRLFGLWVNGGTIYDILCFTFFCLAFSFYVTARQKSGNVTGWRLLGFYALYTLALNSKEMAAGLPAILLAYELIYFTPRLQGLVRWLWDRHAIWLGFAMTLVALKYRMSRHASFYGVGGYKMTFSLSQYFSTTMPLVSQALFLPEEAFSRAGVIVFFLAVWTVALAAKNRAMMLGVAIMILAPLPINFIPPRGFFVMYLPLIGWSLYLAAGLVALRRWLAEHDADWAVGRKALLTGTAAVLFVIQANDNYFSFAAPDINQPRIRQLKFDLAGLRRPLPRDGRVLFLNDAWDGETLNALYIVRLLYGNPEIAVDRVKEIHGPVPPRSTYSLVIDYCGKQYVEATAAGCPNQ
jgi:hypothetical protein